MHRPTISIICALSENRVIGIGDRIPWRIRQDLVRFKEKTLHKTVIMGRATFDSVLGYYQRSGKPMPERNTIIVTRDSSYDPKQKRCYVVHSVEDALQKAQEIESDEVFISGGEQVYKQTIHRADKLYLTIVKGNFAGDKFFPDYSAFTKIISQEEKEENGQKFTFIELVR